MKQYYFIYFCRGAGTGMGDDRYWLWSEPVDSTTWAGLYTGEVGVACLVFCALDSWWP